MKLSIGISDVEAMKADLRAVLPDVKSSHRTEAFARGLGWRTNAAMRVELASGPVSVAPDDDAFFGYLSEHSFEAPNGCLTRILAKSGIRHAMALEPTLTHFGYGIFRDRSQSPEVRKAKFAENRAAMLEEYAVEEFIRAVDYLSRFGKRKTINRNSNSYGLKHQAERFAKGYVANGMLIAAGLALGYTVRPTDPGSPNAFFNITSKPAGKRT
ncbi:hypothetical protein BJ122_11736 [Rhodopseudomonas faecalis]|uniref:Uncharacterized protein n=1 Tax=Rhodopseudomonas faecalis TaxID=99655 RepID=A0A318TB46_9BRAD|nr:hypothetical protein [Rhodopseudomonas faecalis]PYF01813.1 hypothetical protein BJ122_11736 [Rhodopseudomonas faecalis]